jgi:hypothetical protein
MESLVSASGLNVPYSPPAEMSLDARVPMQVHQIN